MVKNTHATLSDCHNETSFPNTHRLLYVVETGVHRGQVHIETKLEHVATRLSQEMKDDRSAVHALRRSLGPSLVHVERTLEWP
jgi:hypothetical protein